MKEQKELYIKIHSVNGEVFDVGWLTEEQWRQFNTRYKEQNMPFVWLSFRHQVLPDYKLVPRHTEAE